jgi:hypothetical protein
MSSNAACRQQTDTSAQRCFTQRCLLYVSIRVKPECGGQQILQLTAMQVWCNS